MRSWLGYFWRTGQWLSFPIVLTLSVFWAAPVLERMLAFVVTFTLVVLGSLFQYHKSRQLDELVTEAESLRRAQPGLPPIEEIDLSRVVVGIVTRGRYKGSYVNIRLDTQGDQVVGGYEIVSKRVRGALAAEADGLSLDELRRALEEHGVEALPQGSYADRIWRDRLKDVRDD